VALPNQWEHLAHLEWKYLVHLVELISYYQIKELEIVEIEQADTNGNKDNRRIHK
jgi:hypothetical protein